MKQNSRQIGRQQRHRRIRAKISGTATRPRLSFFRSSKHVYAQLIDDETGTTLVGASSHKSSKKGATSQAEELGATVAKQALEKGVKQVVFDRGGFMYTGSVKTFADSVRSSGITL